MRRWKRLFFRLWFLLLIQVFLVHAVLTGMLKDTQCCWLECRRVQPHAGFSACERCSDKFAIIPPCWEVPAATVRDTCMLLNSFGVKGVAHVRSPLFIFKWQLKGWCWQQIHSVLYGHTNNKLFPAKTQSQTCQAAVGWWSLIKRLIRSLANTLVHVRWTLVIHLPRGTEDFSKVRRIF